MIGFPSSFAAFKYLDAHAAGPVSWKLNGEGRPQTYTPIICCDDCKATVNPNEAHALKDKSGAVICIDCADHYYDVTLVDAGEVITGVSTWQGDGPKLKRLRCSECGSVVEAAGPEDARAGVMCLECAK